MTGLWVFLAVIWAITVLVAISETKRDVAECNVKLDKLLRKKEEKR